MPRVQSTGKAGTEASNTLSFSFGTLPQANNGIIVSAFGWYSGTQPTLACSDNQGNTYTLAVSRFNVSGARWAAIWYAHPIGTPSGTFTVTVSATGPSARSITAVAVEWSGLASNPLDRTASNIGSGGNVDTTATATTGQAAEVLYAASVFGDTMTTITNSPNGTGSNPSSGWANEIEETDNSDRQAGAVAWVEVSSTLAARHVWVPSLQESYSAVIATFKLAGGGGMDNGQAMSVRAVPLRPRIFAPGHPR